MQATQINQQEFRAVQRRDWNEASRGWRDWSEFIDRSTTPVSERLVAMAGVEPGHHVLDVAAGYGEPSLTAARIVGAQGEVVATDISAGMLEYGRERAAAAGLQNVRFIESDAVSLDFPPGRWGIPRSGTPISGRDGSSCKICRGSMPRSPRASSRGCRRCGISSTD